MDFLASALEVVTQRLARAARGVADFSHDPHGGLSPQRDYITTGRHAPVRGTYFANLSLEAGRRMTTADRDGQNCDSAEQDACQLAEHTHGHLTLIIGLPFVYPEPESSSPLKCKLLIISHSGLGYTTASRLPQAQNGCRHTCSIPGDLKVVQAPHPQLDPYTNSIHTNPL